MNTGSRRHSAYRSRVRPPPIEKYQKARGTTLLRRRSDAIHWMRKRADKKAWPRKPTPSQIWSVVISHLHRGARSSDERGGVLVARGETGSSGGAAEHRTQDVIGLADV